MVNTTLKHNGSASRGTVYCSQFWTLGQCVTTCADVFPNILSWARQNNCHDCIMGNGQATPCHCGLLTHSVLLSLLDWAKLGKLGKLADCTVICHICRT
jgi:hypothetical protein